MVWIATDQFQASTECGSDAQEPTEWVVRGPLAHILRISSFCGLAPLRFVSRDNCYMITVSKPMRLYSYILIIVMVTWWLLNIILNGENKEPSKYVHPVIQHMIFSCKILMDVISIISGVCGAPKRMKNIFRLTESLGSVDKNIGCQSPSKTEKKFYVVVLTILFITSAIILVNLCLWISEVRNLDNFFWTMLSDHIYLFVVSLIMIVLELQFAVTALLVKTRLAALNNALVVITNNVLEDSSIVTLPHERIHQLALSYGTLCDAVQLVNDSYGLPLISLIVAILADFVITQYFFIVKIISSSFRVRSYTLQGIWCIYNAVRILTIVEPCHYTVQEGKITERLVCRLMTMTPHTGLLARRLQLFSKKLMMSSVSYTPLSLFTLDRTLLTAAISAITTYLVILIQFNI